MNRDVPRFDFAVDYAGVTHIGHVRSNNEDVWRVDPSLSLFAVADGMGGHLAGEVAAELCVDTVLASLGDTGAVAAIDAYRREPSLEARRGIFEILRKSAEKANAAVRAEAMSREGQSAMGCTLDVALLVRDRIFLLHVGDGRIYLVRPSTTIQVTHDHDSRALLVAQGKVTLAKRATVHNQLLNAIGRADVLYSDCVVVHVAPGDRLVVTTDGVHEMLGDESILSTHAAVPGSANAATALVGAALARGGRDNATALVIDVGPPTRIREDNGDPILDARDFETARRCPLLCDMPDGLLLRALAMAVEVDIHEGEPLPRVSTTDRVAYVVLQGEIEAPGGQAFGASALLYPESLLGMGQSNVLCKATTPLRVLRLRADDFREVCAADARLASALYERLARHLAGRMR